MLKELLLFTVVMSMVCGAVIKRDRQQDIKNENQLKSTSTAEMVTGNDLKSDTYKKPLRNQTYEELTTGEERTHPKKKQTDESDAESDTEAELADKFAPKKPVQGAKKKHPKKKRTRPGDEASGENERVLKLVNESDQKKSVNDASEDKPSDNRGFTNELPARQTNSSFSNVQPLIQNATIKNADNYVQKVADKDNVFPNDIQSGSRKQPSGSPQQPSAPREMSF